jgi:glutamate 5-kinase
MPRSSYVSHVKRIVVKIGSSSLTSEGILSPYKIDRLVDEIAELSTRGYEVLIVSSGSITAGAGELGREIRHLSIPQKQALASVGQTLLMNEYRRSFKRFGKSVGQILMTEDDVKNRRRFLNLRNTCNTLIRMGVIPVINENDSVVVKEIKLGDNDTLSVHVTNMVEAHLLILLSDINGFYYNLNDEKPADIIFEITDQIKNSAGPSSTRFGTGGMLTKINAADIIITSGEMMVIADAKEENVLTKIVEGKCVGTLFVNNESNSLPGKKRWISFNMNVKGYLTVDNGAKKALVENKKSLLAIGIVKTEGKYSPGDAVEISYDGVSFAKGIVNYSNDDMEQIVGKKTNEIEIILGTIPYDEVIHRDNLILY